MLSSPLEIVQKLHLKFKLKAKIYQFLFWLLSFFLPCTTLILGFFSYIIAAKIWTSTPSYTLNILIISAISSFFTYIINFFLLKRRYHVNRSLDKFLELEKICFDNKTGMYKKVSNPEILLLNRLYKKLGITSILEDVPNQNNYINNENDSLNEMSND